MSLLKRLPEEERLKILMLGATYYLPKIESCLLKAREKVNFFRKKYGCDFVEFEKRKLPLRADFKKHEDWVEWSYWQEVLEEYPSYLSALKRLANSWDERI